MLAIEQFGFVLAWDARGRGRCLAELRPGAAGGVFLFLPRLTQFESLQLWRGAWAARLRAQELFSQARSRFPARSGTKPA